MAKRKKSRAHQESKGERRNVAKWLRKDMKTYERCSYPSNDNV